MHELMKPAELSVLGAILVKERKFRLLELAEELVPIDRLERLLIGIEVDPEDAGMAIFLGGPHGCGTTATLLRPFSDRLVLRGGCAVAHCRTLVSCRTGPP